MNKLQKRIKEVIIEIDVNKGTQYSLGKNIGELRGIKLVQEEILKMIKDLEDGHNGAWVLNELKKLIKGGK